MLEFLQKLSDDVPFDFENRIGGGQNTKMEKLSEVVANASNIIAGNEIARKSEKRKSTEKDYHYNNIRYEAKIREQNKQIEVLNTNLKMTTEKFVEADAKRLHAEKRVDDLEAKLNSLMKDLAGKEVRVNLQLPREWATADSYQPNTTKKDDWNVDSNLINGDVSVGSRSTDIPENSQVTPMEEEAATAVQRDNEEAVNAEQQMDGEAGFIKVPSRRSTGAIPKQTAKKFTKDHNMNTKSNEDKGKASPPMIKIYNVNIKNFTKEITGLLGHSIFTLNIVNRNMIGLMVGTVQDHTMVKQYLEREKISFFTFTPKILRPYSLVVRGLSDTYDVDDLKEFIEERKLNLKVVNIIKAFNDRWIVQLDRESDIGAFRKLRYLLNCRVSIGRYRKKGITQCRNCQRFGHASTNCSMPYRCVKCGGDHGPGKCAVPNKEQEKEVLKTDPKTGQVVKTVEHPVRCVNCGNEGHVASSKQCPVRRRILEGRTGNRKVVVNMAPHAGVAPTTVEIPLSRNTASSVGATKAMPKNNSTVSYAGAVRNRSTDGGASPATATDITGTVTHTMRFFDGECERLLGGDFLTIFNKVGGYLADYRRLKTDEERTRAMVGLMATLVMDR